jgi:mannose-6-phosphate isomerase-like protein (cupin superfamily)
MTSSAKPFVVRADSGESFRSPVGGPMTIKARAETTGGSFTAVENLVPPKEGPPLHRHGREDEMYFILDGHLRFKLGEAIHDAPTGAFVFIPRLTPHSFQNIGDTAARILVMFTPAGMERFFEQQAALPAGPMDSDAHRALAQGAAMEILGPPLAVSDPLDID